MLPAPQQKVDLFIAPDQGCQAPAAQCLEATLGSARAEHLPRPGRLGQALQCERPDQLIVEKAAQETAGACGNHYRVRRRYRLELGRELRGLADRDGLMDGAVEGGAARHDEP